MNIKDLEQITQYFVKYGRDEQLGHKFFHKENDNFKIIITPDKELYQLNTDHEPWGIEIDTIDNLKIRFRSFTGENLENVSRNWDDIVEDYLAFADNNPNLKLIDFLSENYETPKRK